MVYSYLKNVSKEKGAGILVLLDPDKLNPGQIRTLSQTCERAGVDALLIGSSFLFSTTFNESIQEIKQHVSLPLIIFPGNSSQISPHADAMLFLSLISGRNAEYLIGEQVKASPFLYQYRLEAISTGYMLIHSGQMTSVQFMSNTSPLPRTKVDLAVAHALAGEYLGMKVIYMDGGSGAQYSVPEDMIEGVKSHITIPLAVGGGITTPALARQKVEAGADFVVIGTIFERAMEESLMKEFVAAVHYKEHLAML
jgi:phosphoglycerol geranylgeranyltransferase